MDKIFFFTSPNYLLWKSWDIYLNCINCVLSTNNNLLIIIKILKTLFFCKSFGIAFMILPFVFLSHGNDFLFFHVCTIFDIMLFMAYIAFISCFKNIFGFTLSFWDVFVIILSKLWHSLSILQKICKLSFHLDKFTLN